MPKQIINNLVILSSANYSKIYYNIIKIKQKKKENFKMKKQIILNEENIEALTNLITEIQFEESQDEECNSDLVIDNMYKVVSILEGVLGISI